MDKSTLRKKIKSLKKQYTPEELQEKSTTICKQIEQHPLFRKAQTILLYHALADEVNTCDILHKYYKEKQLILPVIHEESLELKLYTGDENLIQEEKFGIYEPKGEIIQPETIELAFIPGMAFDSTGHRLGRGKGYYDRLLGKVQSKRIYKIGVCFDFQMLSEIPCEQHDIIMDEIISD